MIYLKETTDWSDAQTRVPNHTYILEGSRAVGYIKEGTTEEIWFKKPMNFDKRYRTFKELKPAKSNLIEVQGSKGKIYYVDPAKGTCTCPGFQFRGYCKHVESV